MSLVRRGGDFIQKGSCRMNNHVECRRSLSMSEDGLRFLMYGDGVQRI